MIEKQYWHKSRILITKTVFSLKGLIALLTLFVLVFCLNNWSSFSFRGHRFGDSMEEVLRSEKGEPKERLDSYLDYANEDLFDGKVHLVYYFNANKLRHILIVSEDEIVGEEVYDYVLYKLKQYGNPDHTSASIYRSTKNPISELFTRYVNIFFYTRKALWKKDDFGIVLLYDDYRRFIVIVSDPVDAQKAYDNFETTDDVLNPHT